MRCPQCAPLLLLLLAAALLPARVAAASAAAATGARFETRRTAPLPALDRVQRWLDSEPVVIFSASDCRRASSPRPSTARRGNSALPLPRRRRPCAELEQFLHSKHKTRARVVQLDWEGATAFQRKPRSLATRRRKVTLATCAAVPCPAAACLFSAMVWAQCR